MMADVSAIIDYILGLTDIDQTTADYNGDGSVNIADISEIIDYILKH